MHNIEEAILSKMEIWYLSNGEKIGPKKIEDLAPCEIDNDTLVWFSGEANWVKANDVQDLQNYLKNSPPPFPPDDKKYDKNYEREIGVAVFGVIMLVASLTLVGLYSKNIIPSNYKSYLWFSSAIARIAITIGVYKIAKDQNRRPEIWLLIAFIFPAISLIIIGLLPRYAQKAKSSFTEDLDSLTDED